MRKLATASLAFSAAIFAANYILPTGWLILPAVIAAVLGAALALLREKWLRPVVIALVFFALGLLDYAMYYRCTVEKAAGYAGQEREITGVLVEYPDVYEDYCRLRIRLKTEDMPGFCAIVYDNDKTMAEAAPGDQVRFTARISTADTIYGKPYDNYHVNGYFLRLSSRSKIEKIGSGLDLRTAPVLIRHRLCAAIDHVFPDTTRAFMKALMLGDKQEFYDDDALYVAMTRAGLMHVVAVSGLHIAFLVGLLQFIFGRGRRGSLISIAMVWLFVLVTGSGKAAVRAGFMQSLLLLAPLVKRENDPVTSLSAILALVLGFSPLAARSVSLQLSFSAMAGILCFFDPIYQGITDKMPWIRKNSILRYVAATVTSSLSVMVFTVPLTAAHFGYVPLLSVLTNIACLWAVSLCFSCGWAACVLGFVPILGEGLAILCTLLVRFIFLCARTVALNPYSVLYTKMPGAWAWLLGSYLLFAVTAMLRKMPVWRYAAAAGLSLMLLCMAVFSTTRSYRTNDTITVLNIGQGQCIAAMSGDATAVIDCGNTGSIDNAGALAGEYLLSRGRDHIDILMLTHLHADHADGAVRLMEMLRVDTLILPVDADDSDGLCDEILSCAERNGVRVVRIDRDSEASCGAVHLDLYKSASGMTENERCLMTKLTVGELVMLVTADATKAMEQELAGREDLTHVQILVVGHHGSRYASSPVLLEAVGGRLAVISSGYNNYGHPAEETLERLERYGYNIYRTDSGSDIEFQTGG